MTRAAKRALLRNIDRLEAVNMALGESVRHPDGALFERFKRERDELRARVDTMLGFSPITPRTHAPALAAE